MKLDKSAILQAIDVLEAEIVLAKLGCRRRGLQSLMTPSEGVHWILKQPHHQRSIMDLKQAIHPLYAALAHARGRIHAADNNPQLQPKIDQATRRHLPLHQQTPEFCRAWMAQECYVQKMAASFMPTQTVRESESVQVA
jgi:hypothetical protein